MGASDATLPLGTPKWPISRPGARAGLIWLETGGAGESYRVGYPDGCRGGGSRREKIGDGLRLDTDQQQDFA